MARRKSRKQEEQPRELTRKEHRIRARDRERNQKIMLGAGIAIGLALLVVLVGLVFEFFVKPSSAVAAVGDTTIVTRDYWKRVHLEQNQLQNQLIRMSQLEQQFGGQGFFTSQINQIQATLSSPFALGVQVLDNMIDEEVVRQEAAARGITVTEEEVDQALREEIAGSQGAVTVPQATATAEAAVEATETAAAWTPTPVPTVDASASVTATVAPSPTPEPIPTRPVLTDSDFTTGLETLESSLQEIAGMSLAEYREIVRARLLADKLREIVAEERVTSTEEQVHARHILLTVREPEPTPAPAADGTPEATASPTLLPEGAPTPIPTPAPRDEEATLALAEELRTQLVDEGADFGELAMEYSNDPGSAAQGGDLGWFGRGVMVPAFEEAAFSLEVGEVSEPIRSDFGYHLIEVMERDESHPKDPSTIENERFQAYDDWLRETIAAKSIERPDDLVAKLPRDLQEPQPVIAPIDSAPGPSQ